MENKIENRVEQLVLEILQDQSEIELVDVEYTKEKDWYLRIFIDREGGIEIDDCQLLSEKLEALLDTNDFIPERYILEVSSPGLDRILRKPRDFVRECGKQVDVSLYVPLDGMEGKHLIGKLMGCDDSGLHLEARTPIPMDKVAQVRLHIDF